MDGVFRVMMMAQKRQPHAEVVLVHGSICWSESGGIDDVWAKSWSSSVSFGAGRLRGSVELGSAHSLGT